MRREPGEWGVGLISREGVHAWLTPAEARELARDLEQMAAITEAPGKAAGE